jgi:hypothetical protein
MTIRLFTAILVLGLASAQPLASAPAVAGSGNAGPEVNPSVPAPAQAQQARGQVQGRGQADRPTQAQQGRDQVQGPANRPAQAQQARGQGQGRGQADRPTQAQQGRDQGQGPANRPSQAQQGRGQGQGQGQASPQAERRGPPESAGRPAAPGRSPSAAPGGSAPGRGTSGASPARRGGVVSPAELSRRVREMPPAFQRMASSSRRSEAMVLGAAARGYAWGMDPDLIDVQPSGDRVVVRNRRGDLLVDLDDRRARELGYWNLRRLGDRRATGNAPAFCRSGAGHPVWGREWCLDRGHGLGSRTGTIWSRTRVDDVVFRRTVDRDRLARDVLIGVVGDVVLNRLGLHALSMGYTDPLYGHWIAEPDAPRILYVSSGDVVVAEFVDLDRDDRVDVLYVLQPL